jgi:hypothetical protein
MIMRLMVLSRGRNNAGSRLVRLVVSAMSPERLRLCTRITQPRRRPRRARQGAAANGLADTARSIIQELEVVAAAERVDVAVTLRSGVVAGAGGDGPA